MSKAILHKKLFTAVAALLALIVLLFIPTSVFAANNTYTVTYSAGNVAEFKDSVYSRYEGMVGTNGIVKAEKTSVGNVKITLNANSAIPSAPTAEDIVYKTEAEGRYSLLDTWTPVAKGDTVVKENVVYVMDYETLTDGVAYKVQYVDSESGMIMATTINNMGNIGELRAPGAIVIDGFTCDNPDASIVLTKDASKNVLTYYYSAIPVIEDVEVFVAQQAQINANGVNQAIANGPQAAQNAQVADELVPQGLNNGANKDNNANGKALVPDENVPEGAMQNKVLLTVVIVAAAGAAAGIAAAVVVKTRKAKAAK